MSRPKGSKLSKEHAEKIGKGNLGKKVSEEHKQKTSNSLKGIKRSEETKQKMSLAARKRMIDYGPPRLGKKCSLKHRMNLSESHRGEKSSLWKGGISFEPYCPKFNRMFRERVREFFGRTCVECGKPEGNTRLSVHHVNFNKMSCCDGDKPLFVALCNSCHIKTNHNREYWIKHFTEIINTKYNGKCY